VADNVRRLRETPTGKQLHVTIEIDATPERVWQVLTHFAAYPDWNPFITRASGTSRPSERLYLRMQPPGGRGATVRPTVLEADPGRRLRWLGHVLLPGPVRRRPQLYHRTARRPSGSRHPTGAVPRHPGPLAATSLDRHTLSGLQQLNQALKRRAEQLQHETVPGPADPMEVTSTTSGDALGLVEDQAVLVSGVWNSFIKLGLPVLALALVLLQGGAGGGRVIAALLGIAGLVGAIVVFALMLRREEAARRFGVLAGRVASRVLRLFGRPPVAGWELATVKFRSRTIDLVEHRWGWITVTSLVSHLSLYLVLLVALRDVGLSNAEVNWAEVLAVFAFAGWPQRSRSLPVGGTGGGGADRRAGRGRRRQARGGRRRAGLPRPHLAAAGPAGRRDLSVVAAAVMDGAEQGGPQPGRRAGVMSLVSHRAPAAPPTVPRLARQPASAHAADSAVLPCPYRLG
jgi:hypothetical protein